MTEPKTLQEAVVFFNNPDNCLNYMVERIWPDGVACPRCGRKDVTFLKNQRKWQCRSHHPMRQFSVKTGTIFEDSPLPLDKWLTVSWMVTNCKNGISSYEIHRAIHVTQKTAWFMLHRIRKAMQTESFMRKMSGHVEVDETFIGGKARNMHKSKRDQVIHGRGTAGKVVVMGSLQRGSDNGPSQVRTEVVENRHRETLQGFVKQNVRKGSKLYTDEFSGYTGLENDYDHRVINHAIEYVKGKIHTNAQRTSDRCLSGAFMARMFLLNRFSCSAIWTNRSSDSITALPSTTQRMTQIVSVW